MTWRTVNKISDAPDHDCLVAYICVDQHIIGDNIDDAANLGCGVGWLSWSKRPDLPYRWWSIIDDGEIVSSSEVGALCEMLTPVNLIHGSGALLESAENYE